MGAPPGQFGQGSPSLVWFWGGALAAANLTSSAKARFAPGIESNRPGRLNGIGADWARPNGAQPRGFETAPCGGRLGMRRGFVVRFGHFGNRLLSRGIEECCGRDFGSARFNGAQKWGNGPIGARGEGANGNTGQEGKAMADLGDDKMRASKGEDPKPAQSAARNPSSRFQPIAAIATAMGRGGVGVVRISGEDLAPLLPKLTDVGRLGAGGKAVAPRRAVLSDFYDALGDPIDRGVVVYYKAPASYTGQDVIELMGHGGPSVMETILKACLDCGCRMAEPGEFTKLAFLNGKMDLAQAEGVAELIDAGSAAAARMALRTLKGEFSEATQSVVDDLIQLRALTEASIDFTDEEIDFLGDYPVRETLGKIYGALGRLIARADAGAVFKNGVAVALVGAPNVGKSSLLNRLAGYEAAIVTDIPGTTRDAVKEDVSLGGAPFRFVDTAGLRETDDPIEKIGVTRSRSAMAEADLVLVLADATAPWEDLWRVLGELPEGLGAQRALLAVNKIDKLPLAGQGDEALPGSIVADLGWDGLVGAEERFSGVFPISAKTGQGVGKLIERLKAAAGVSATPENAIMATLRQRQALSAAAKEIEAAAERLNEPDLMAEHLRRAQESLGEITGEFAPDDLLGKIFGQFCIGK